MIEKLKEQDLHLGYIEPEEVLLKKINELVDAVNELQEAFESIHPCLKYKDRLNWIGRRCNFSNDCENWIEDMFVNIDRTDSEPEIPKYRALNGKLYKYCKLVAEPEVADPEVADPAQNAQPNINPCTKKAQDELDRTRKILRDTIKLAEQMLESIQDEGMCSSYYEDTLNKIKSIAKGGNND